MTFHEFELGTKPALILERISWQNGWIKKFFPGKENLEGEPSPPIFNNEHIKPATEQNFSCKCRELALRFIMIDKTIFWKTLDAEQMQTL